MKSGQKGQSKMTNGKGGEIMPNIDFDKIKEAISKNKSRVIAGAGAGILGAAAIGTIMSSKREEQNPKSNQDSSSSIVTEALDEYDYVVKYTYTNEYSELPDGNKVQVLRKGDVLEISDISHIQNGGYYNEENENWQEVSSEEARIQTPWIIGKTLFTSEAQDQENEGYIPFEYVDMYIPYKTIAKIHFRSEPSTDGGAETVLATAKKEDNIYVLEDSDVIKNGKHEWIKALMQIDGKYVEGYVAQDIGAIEQDLGNNGIGVINTNTFLRVSPIVSELDESIIKGQVENGKRVKVVDTFCGDKETWHKCMIQGEEGYTYLSDLSIKPINDFESKVLLTNSADITTKDGGKVRKSLEKDSVLKVDTSNCFNGRYEVMFDSNENGCTVGYMDAESLGLSPVLTPTTITTEDTDITTSESNTTEATTTHQSEVAEDKEDKLVYQVDIMWAANNPNKIINEMDGFKAKDEIAGVYFEIGISSHTMSTKDKLFMHTLGDDTEEYRAGESDGIHLIATDVMKIKSSFNNGVLENSSKTLGNIKNLERCINEAIKRDIPVGLYYYQGAADNNRASAEAAYIYTIINKLKYDLGDKYINAKKLPIMIDIEKTYSSAAKDEERLEAASKTVRLLGNGEGTDGCWTITGENGYNVLDDYKNQVTFYFDINGQRQGLGYNDATMISKIDGLKQYGYRPIINTTRAADDSQFQKQYSNLYDKETMFKKMQNNSYYKAHPELVEMSDVIQCALDLRKGSTFDFSLTTQNTIDRIVDGTYQHTDYNDKIQKVIDSQRNRFNSERSERE